MTKIECLKSAYATIDACQKAGKVTADDLKSITAVIALGIAPPAVTDDRRALTARGIEALPGTWEHFADTLCRAVEEEWDAAKMKAEAQHLRAKGDAERAQRLENREYFFRSRLLSPLRQAVFAAIKAEEAEMKRQEAEAKRRAEEEKKAAEARLSAEARAQLEAKRAAERKALDDLMAAARGNAKTPAVVPATERDDGRRERRERKPKHERKAERRAATPQERVAIAIRKNLAGDETHRPLDLDGAVARAFNWSFLKFPGADGFEPALIQAALDAFVEGGMDAETAKAKAETLFEAAKAAADKPRPERRNRPDARVERAVPSHGEASPAEIAAVQKKAAGKKVGKGAMAEALKKAGLVATAPGGDA